MCEEIKEIGQKYEVTTFDFGLCIMAYPLYGMHLENTESMSYSLVHSHFIHAYMKATENGLAEVFLETGMIGLDCLAGVMSGKHNDMKLKKRLIDICQLAANMGQGTRWLSMLLVSVTASVPPGLMANLNL